MPRRQVHPDEPRALRATITVSFRRCAPSSPAPSASATATARRLNGPYDALVIGSGMGGLTTAALLSAGCLDVGGLTPGYWGDVCVIGLAGLPLVGLAADPVEWALAAGPRDVMATWHAGNEVWRRT